MSEKINKFTMTISLNVLNHLGINLYSNVPAVLSEIVANAWDAEASLVNIKLCNKKDKSGLSEIIIHDNGNGMSIEDINDKFLSVGYERRVKEGSLTKTLKRPVMGRKGIGKLSTFAIANIVEVYTKKENEEQQSFLLDAKKIKEILKGDSEEKEYHPEEIISPIMKIDNKGTIIVLKSLKSKISIATEAFLKKRIARRFSVFSDDFKVQLNDAEIKITDRDYFHKLQFLWYFGEESKKYVSNCDKLDDRTAENVFKLDNNFKINGREVKITGWIGTSRVSGDLVDDKDNLNKIAIIVRGKLGLEDILSDFNEGGLYTKYIIGEVHADFLDDDDFEDIAISSRQGYDEEDIRYIELKNFLLPQIKEVDKKWNALRKELGVSEAIEIYPVVQNWLDEQKGDHKKQAVQLIGKINNIKIEDQETKKELLKSNIIAFEKLKYKNELSKLDSIKEEGIEAISIVLGGIDEIESSAYYGIIEDRLSVISKLRKYLDAHALEKLIQDHIFNHLWILDPSWSILPDTQETEITGKKILAEFKDIKLSQEILDSRVDIIYSNIADKQLVIELKKYERKISFSDLNSQLYKYSQIMDTYKMKTGKPYEILFLIGSCHRDYDTAEKLDKIHELIKPLNARIVFYDHLLANAEKAYDSFLEKKREFSKLNTIINEISKAK